MKKRKGIFFSLLVLSVSLPVVTSATEIAIAPQSGPGSIELRSLYQKKQFFGSKPPKKLGKLSLIKTEKAKGGYYGYYN